MVVAATPATGTAHDPHTEAALPSYYPAGGKEGGKAKGVRWLPHRMYLYGYQVFLLNVIGNVENPRPLWARALIELPLTLLVTPIMYIWFCLFVAPIQASSCEPLLEPPDGKKWPVVVFSHGLAGHRSAYSELCTRLARRGVFVAALEHMDGSASMSAREDGTADSERSERAPPRDRADAVSSWRAPRGRARTPSHSLVASIT